MIKIRHEQNNWAHDESVNNQRYGHSEMMKAFGIANTHDYGCISMQPFRIFRVVDIYG